MKKIILIIFLLCMCSCNKESNEYKIYSNYINELNKYEESNKEDLPFNIDIKLEKLNNTLIIYELTIDNVKYDLNDVEVLIIHDKETKDIYPSIGIFEDKITLSTNKTDKENNISKGIILVGYIDQIEENATFKVLVKYKYNNQENKIVYVKQF